MALRKVLFIALTLAMLPGFAQRINGLAFRFTEDNDFLNLTQRGIDRYYTQGLRLEFVYATAKPVAFEKWMLRASSKSVNQYSWLISQQMYTPRQTFSLNFVGDRPYASTLYASQQLISFDSAKQLRLSTRLDVGLIGPASLGEYTQKLFHKIINNRQALGWHTQLRNDLVLNYQVTLEKRLVQINLFRIEAKAMAQAGTLLVQGVGGLNFLLSNKRTTKEFQWEVFFKPEVRAVAFNALLQGGILNQLYADEPYAQYFLSNVEPWVYSHATGFRLRYKRWELQYQQTNVTREFSSQLPHYFGSVTATFWFKSANIYFKD